MFQRRFDGALMLLLNLCLAYWSRQRWALTNRIFRFSVLLFVALSAKDGFRVVNLTFYVLAAVAFSSALVVVVSTAMWLLYAWAEGAEKVDSQSERVDPGVWEKILDRYVIAETRKKS